MKRRVVSFVVDSDWTIEMEWDDTPLGRLASWMYGWAIRRSTANTLVTTVNWQKIADRLVVERLTASEAPRDPR